MRSGTRLAEHEGRRGAGVRVLIRVLCGVVAVFAAQRFCYDGNATCFMLTIGAPWIGVMVR
jgi:hypothetical protein